MRFYKKVGILSAMFALPIYAGTMSDVVEKNDTWFAAIGTGFSWTLKPGISNPAPNVWDYATQGYDASMGDRGFYTFAVGKQVHQYIDLSIDYLVHEIFNYQKYQSGDSSTPDFTGTRRNRYFNLNNRALFVNGFLHPSRFFNAASLDWRPYVGAGIGYAYNRVNNFYTISTKTISGTAIGSTDTIGAPTGTNSFAWQGIAAMSVKVPDSHLRVNTGYRYYDGGKFRSSKAYYTNSSGWVNAPAWSGRLKANQLFVEFQYNV